MNRTETTRSLSTEFTNRFAWDVLPDNSWRNQPCFIIGGGPSLAHFNWGLLKDKLTIGINRVYEKMDPTIIFGMDPHFVRWILMGKYGDEAKKKFMESRAFKVWLLTATVSLPSYIHILKVWKDYASGRYAFPFSMKKGIGHGCNSGYAALNFAACLGANPIYLLGYDMKGAHWHDGHPVKHGIQDENEKMAMFIENMAHAAQALKERGVTVINLNPESALPCFPKMEMSKGFEDCVIKVIQHDAEMKIDDKALRNKGYPFSADRLTNRFAHEVLPDGAWRNKPCFIVGGGPSLRDFDWNTLRGKRTIGINRVYEMFDPTVIFSMDTRFFLWVTQGKYGPEAACKFDESVAYKIWLCTYNCKLPEDVFIVPVWKNYKSGFRAFSSSLREGIGHGNNSGYAAINLAACLGADPIYLVGFDMKYKTEDGQMQTHWHEGHPIPHREDTVYKFSKYFPCAAKGAKEMNLRIINLNPDSGLDCFPKKPWQEVLH